MGQRRKRLLAIEEKAKAAEVHMIPRVVIPIG